MRSEKNYLTDYHQRRNKVVLQEVLNSSKQPTSLKAAIEQVKRIKEQSQSAEKKGQV